MMADMLNGVGWPLHADPGNQPPALTWGNWWQVWTWSWWVVIPLALSLGLYLYGVRRLAARGDAWEKRRTFMWVQGHVVAVIATLSFLGAYDAVLFSIHMVQHMLLSMIVPVMLAQGAPLTLALRVLSGRPRETLVKVVHSLPAKALLFPPLTTAAMVMNGR